MDVKALRYAIEDAKRFIQRASDSLFDVENAEIPESDIKTIRRLSLDVTHAMKDLRDSIDVSPATQPAAAQAD